MLAEVELSTGYARIRDIFLFSCYTGMAYIDVKQFRRYHISKDTDYTYYINKRQKTGQDCIIPLLPAAVRILERYTPTQDFRDFEWYVSSNQKMNKGLKEIGEKSGLNTMLHFYLARHTFGTKVALSNGVPMETVSSMLGASTLRQTQHYAKIAGTKVKTDMAKIKGKGLFR